MEEEKKSPPLPVIVAIVVVTVVAVVTILTLSPRDNAQSSGGSIANTISHSGQSSAGKAIAPGQEGVESSVDENGNPIGEQPPHIDNPPTLRDRKEGVTPVPRKLWSNELNNMNRIYGEGSRAWVLEKNVSDEGAVKSAHELTSKFAVEFVTQNTWETQDQRDARLLPMLTDEAKNLASIWMLEAPSVRTSPDSPNRFWQTAELGAAQVHSVGVQDGVKVALTEASISRAQYSMSENANAASYQLGQWQMVFRLEDNGSGWKVSSVAIPQVASPGNNDNKGTDGYDHR